MKITFTPTNSEQTRLLFEVQQAFERSYARAARRWEAQVVSEQEGAIRRSYDDLEADALAGFAVVETNAVVDAATEALEHARGETALATTEVEAPVKRKRRTKAEMEAARAAEAPVPDSQDPAQLELPTPTPAAEPSVQEKPSLETVREAMKAYAERKGAGAVGVNAARELIGTFGVQRLSDLKEKDYAAFIVAATK